MGRATPIFTNFTAGELSPLMGGRVDFQKYFSGCSILKNLVVTPHGPAIKRSGTRHLAPVKYQDKDCRLLPFTFSTEQEYILELGDAYLRFYMEDDSTGWGRIEVAGVPTEVVSPYDEDEIWQVKFCQKADVMFLVHPLYPPRVLTRASHTSWAMAILTIENGPFLPENLDDTITITPSAVTGNGITLTANSALFTADHVGSTWKIRHDIEETLQTVTESFDGSARKREKTTVISGEGQTMPIILNPDEYLGYEIVGAFSGTLELQVSFGLSFDNQGGVWQWTQNWLTVEEFTGPTSFNSIKVNHTEIVYFRFNCTAHTSGTPDIYLYRYADIEGLTSSAVSIAPGEKLQYALSGTFNGTFKLERTWDGGAHWDTFSTHAGTLSVDEEIENSFSETVQYRWRHWEYVSGTCTATLVQKKETGGSGWVEITAFTSSTVVTGNVVSEDDLHSTDATELWSEGAWSEEQGYPGCVCFHENRLVFGGTPGSPESYWMSKTGGFDSERVDMETGPEATDGLSFQTLDGEVNAAIWVKSMESLTAGTSGGEWRIGPVNAREPLTPDNIDAKNKGNEGSYDIDAIKINGRILFVQSDQEAVMELAQVDDSVGYVPPNNVSLLSEHITRGGIVDWTYQSKPHGIVWVVRDDGVLLSFTYLPQHEVFGWARHVTGQDNSLDDPGDHSFKSVAVAKGSKTLLAIVDRTNTGGSDRKYVELLNPFFTANNTGAGRFLDSSVVYSGTATDTITGLSHLEGETVSVLGDGIERPREVVSDGQVVLASQVSNAVVGYGYNADLRTMRIEAGRSGGSSQGIIKKFEKAIIRFYNTWSGQAGVSFDDLATIEWLNIGFILGAPPTLRSEDIKLDAPGTGDDTDGYVCIRSSQPYPMTVLAIIAHVQTADG